MSQQEELERLFHPPLDPSLIAAICYDSKDLQDAKQTLEILKAEAIVDGFENGYISPSFEALSDSEDTTTNSKVTSMSSEFDELEAAESDAIRYGRS